MTEQENFTAVLKKVLTVSKDEMKRRLAEEKAAKSGSSARVPVSLAKHG
jgi:hypothetical protein